MIIFESHAKDNSDITVTGYQWIGSEARTGATGGELWYRIVSKN